VARVVLYLLVLFFLLTVLRGLRIFFRAVFPKGVPRPGGSRPPALEGEMVRDPVCGTWLDRRLAVAARRGGETVSVCSDDCRRRLEAG
jgi:YHS domain-containing protein